jgi:tetratricopeptide (TPR) repeat protein
MTHLFLAKLLIYLCFCSALGQPMKAFAQKKQSLKYAAKLIQKERFDESIEYLRVMLRKDRKNYNAWTLLGVSYFHSGLPKRSLKILKYAENKATNKPYNHYYQGLAYDALRKKKQSRKYFKMVAASKSIYADPAAFELAAAYYNMKKKYEAQKWINFYLTAFPDGRYRRKALKMQKNMETNRMSKKVSGIKKPNLEEALFKYGTYSLMDIPHFWHFSSSGKYIYETGFEPSTTLSSQAFQDEIFALQLDAGIGLGPYRTKNITSYVGYRYDQTWNSSQERIATFFQDPLDIQYFPFRPDLLEREHSFYGDTKAKLPYSLFTGAFLKYSISMFGSNISGPEAWSIEASYRSKDEIVFIPWFGYGWSKNHRTLVSWYFNKTTDQDENELSYKTYSFTMDTFPISLGLTHSSDFPSIQTSLNIDLYKYEFIYNDPYKDHNRVGVLASLSHQLIPTIDITLTGAYYTDTYIEPTIKLDSCNTLVKSTKQVSIDDPVKNCTRIDTGYLIEGEISWAYRQFYEVFVNFSSLSNVNENLKEKGFEQQEIMAGLTLAFPSVKRVIRYSERAADKALERSVRP